MRTSIVFLALILGIGITILYTRKEPLPKYVWSKAFGVFADKASKPLTVGFRPKDYKSIKNGDLVWVRTGHLPEFIRDVLPHTKAKFVLITADGDESVPFFFQDRHKEVLSLAEDDRIIHWFTQNYDPLTPSDKVSPIPIGLDFHTRALRKTRWEKKRLSPKKQELLLEEILKTLRPTHERIPIIFTDFHLNDSIRRGFNKNQERFGENRAMIRDKLKTTGLVSFQPSRRERVLVWKEKGAHMFSISPMGNGLDCYRTWEDLVLGCIVIVKTSPLDPLFKDLPVVIIKDWDEITQENLLLWQEQYSDAFTNPSYREKLTGEYWYKLMLEKAKPYRL